MHIYLRILSLYGIILVDSVPLFLKLRKFGLTIYFSIFKTHKFSILPKYLRICD